MQFSEIFKVIKMHFFNKEDGILTIKIKMKNGIPDIIYSNFEDGHFLSDICFSPEASDLEDFKDAFIESFHKVNKKPLLDLQSKLENTETEKTQEAFKSTWESMSFYKKMKKLEKKGKI